MTQQFSLAKKIGIGLSVVLVLILVVSLGLLYKTQKKSLDLLIHDKAERVLLALQASHTQAMLHRDSTKDHDPVLEAFNESLETLKKTEKDMDIWLFMSQKVIDYQKSQHSIEIEPPKDEHDVVAAKSLLKTGHFETESLYRLSYPIILGQGVANNPKCFECHEQLMGIRSGELIGGISVAYDASKDIKEFNAVYSNTVVFVVVLILVLSLFVFVLINRLVSRPIKSISGQLKRLSVADNLLVIPDVKEANSLEIAQILESMHKIFDVSTSNVFNFRSALDEHNIVSIADLDGNISFVNDLFCEVSGYSREELIGQNHRLLNSGEHKPEFFEDMWACISQGTVWKGDIKNKAKNGSFYWVRSTVMPFLNEEGTPYEYVSIRTDITHIKKKEIEMIQLSHEAQAANQAKSQFLATMSHEIRTPMNGVLGMAQLLEGTKLDAEQKDYLATITSSGQNLLNIINDILDFSKLDAHKVELEKIPFDLECVCQECLSLVSGNIQGKPLELVLDYQPECPRYYLGDPARIKQILLNLLSNAIKFTSEGYVRCGVQSRSTSTNEQVKIQIEDTGIGLKPESIEHLFDEFTQADASTTRQYGGTGLGLSICNKLLDIMGGEIQVTSTYGKGTVFTVCLELPKAEQPEKLEERSLHGVRLLFVDDNKVNRRVFKRQLEHMGIQVKILANSLDTIDTLHTAIHNKTPFQIAVIDQNMPNMNGLELGQAIRKDGELNDLKLMIFSSAGAKGDAALFAQSGFDAYLNKLSRYETVQSILSAMLQHKTGSPIITRHNIAEAQQLEQEVTFSSEIKILLVEDVKANQVIAQKMLNHMGLSVDLAINGEQAVEAFNQQSYALIFMDCRMPVMDGFEATKVIRKLEQAYKKSHTPIIALTANKGADDSAECREAGMDELLSKPFKKSDLIDCLQRFIGSNHQLINQAIVFDEVVYKSLKEEVGEDIEEIVAVSLQSMESNIKELQSLKVDDDIQNIIRLAHSIKSPAGFIGAAQLSELSASLEDALRHNKAINVKDSIEQIQQAFIQFRKIIMAVK